SLQCFAKFSFCNRVSRQTSSSLTRALSVSKAPPAMSINLQSHAFAGNPLLSKFPISGDTLSPSAALEALNARIGLNSTYSSPSPSFKVLPFRNGRPLASSAAGTGDLPPIWRLGWLGLDDLRGIFENSGAHLSADLLVYLCSSAEDDAVYWAIDVSANVPELDSNVELCFVELRTLMVATDWSDLQAMGNLAIAGHAKALLEWHNISRFCGHCGEKTVPMEAGRRKKCSNDSCKKRIYPRVDPVVIMLVIDRENDRALLAKRPMPIPRLYTCLSGFTEPGESLEEAVRRETWEETGVEVGEVVYHSSQPWPVGPNSIPCQLMVGFFAYARSLAITVDKKELEDAQWYSREDVRKALMFAKYKQAQRTAAAKVEQMCKGVEKNRSLAADFNVESADEHAPIVVPGPFAIAHHLISSWAFSDQNLVNGVESNSKQPIGVAENFFFKEALEIKIVISVVYLFISNNAEGFCSVPV
ncbi:Nudix hydrolase 19, chloroplastic, partial [Mucuna pruriens]